VRLLGRAPVGARDLLDGDGLLGHLITRKS
jgi:hypothetical protein